ncbi:IS1 family transposase [Photobacterium damselae]|nr:IS1 family transposase [Photobacterium damselae]
MLKKDDYILNKSIGVTTRKTIGFSKSEEMHDKVIGTFIEREFYH